MCLHASIHPFSINAGSKLITRCINGKFNKVLLIMRNSEEKKSTEFLYQIVKETVLFLIKIRCKCDTRTPNANGEDWRIGPGSDEVRAVSSSLVAGRVVVASFTVNERNQSTSCRCNSSCPHPVLQGHDPAGFSLPLNAFSAW